MQITLAVWVAMVVGSIIPLMWWWNYFWYALPVTFRCSRSRTKLPPGHMGVPFFGEMPHFLWYFKVIRRPDDYINTKRKRYGDGEGLYTTHLFGSPSIIACSPSANKFILQSSDENFGMGWPAIDIIGKNSMIALQGSSHARIRSLVVKAINQPDALRRIAMMVQPRIVESLQQWAKKGRIVAFREVRKVTFENIGKYFSGIEPGHHLDKLDELFTGMIKGVRGHPINIPGTDYHYALQCRKKVMAIFAKEIEMRKNKKWDATTTSEYDLMDGLMRLKDENGKELQDEEVLDNIVGLIIGGYESTSLAIMWAIYQLAKHPNVLKKLQEEHKGIRTNDGFITRDDIVKLQYTSKVVEEIIRLANVSAFVFRTAKRDMDYKGYKIPKGWRLICWLRYIHTDPNNFQNPLCFDPDRWNEQAMSGTYLVFGRGSRICAGNMLARLQVAIFIHHLVVGYRWELVNPNAGMTYLPHPKPIDGVEINISRI